MKKVLKACLFAGALVVSTSSFAKIYAYECSSGGSGYCQGSSCAQVAAECGGNVHYRPVR